MGLRQGKATDAGMEYQWVRNSLKFDFSLTKVEQVGDRKSLAELARARC